MGLIYTKFGNTSNSHTYIAVFLLFTKSIYLEQH